MPAKNFHRRKKIIRSKSNFSHVFKRLAIYLGLLVFFVLTTTIIATFIKVHKDVGLGKPINTVIVYKNDLVIVRFDPSGNSMLFVNLPGNLLLDTAGGYGQYQLKNVFDLGENEKRGDDLIKKTLMKNLHVPIHLLVDCRKFNFKNDSIFSTLECMEHRNIRPLTLLVYAGTKSGKNIESKNLSDYRVLLKSDVQENTFQLTENVFNRLEFDFSQDMSLDQINNVRIETQNESSLPDYLADVIKTMGGRVVEGVSGKSVVSSGCTVSGGDRNFIEDIGRVFNCKIVFDKSQGSEAIFSISEQYLKTF